jgi:polyisoprenoid-binding protein YceI
MRTVEATGTTLPAGRWEVDAAHSRVAFAVDYVVGTFHGSFAPVKGTLEIDGGGDLSIRGVSRAVPLQRVIREPKADPFGRTLLSLRLETTIDRTAFGIDWNNPLPNGEPSLANAVDITAELYLVRS